MDYVGVFNNLQKALAIYAGSAGSEKDETPIKDKAALVKALEDVLDQAGAFVQPLGVDVSAIMAADALVRFPLIARAVRCWSRPTSGDARSGSSRVR